MRHCVLQMKKLNVAESTIRMSGVTLNSVCDECICVKKVKWGGSYLPLKEVL
jgi:hypothetical protein